MARSRFGLGRFGALLVMLALGVVPACGLKPGPSTNPSSVSRTAALDRSSDPSNLLDKFQEGAELPAGWPADLIPLPPGTKVVARLDSTTLPGVPGKASAVFYSLKAPADQIVSFFAKELPKKGWNVQASAEESPADASGPYREIAALNGSYIALIGGGEVPQRPPLKTGEVISIQIILARLPAAPNNQ
jgi:hypothetical protein